MPKLLPPSLRHVVTLIFLAGCGAGVGDVVTPPENPARMIITGDSVLKVGANGDLLVTLENATGAAPKITWSIDRPGVAGFRTSIYTLGAEIPLVGRSSGSATVTVSAGSNTATYRIRVQDDRPVTAVALGAEVSGTLVNG